MSFSEELWYQCFSKIKHRKVTAKDSDEMENNRRLSGRGDFEKDEVESQEKGLTNRFSDSQLEHFILTKKSMRIQLYEKLWLVVQ